jgi:hypothetical protein
MGVMGQAFKTPAKLPDGVWQVLLQHASSLVDEIAARGIQDPFWTFGHHVDRGHGRARG